jgi:uncharacterized protein YpmS
MRSRLYTWNQSRRAAKTHSEKDVSEPKEIRPRRKHTLLNVLLSLVLLLLLLVLVVLFLVEQRPGFYVSHSQRNRDKLARDAYAFNLKVQDFLSAVWSERRFPLELTEDDVNGYLAAVNDDAIWQGIPLKFEGWRKMFTSDWLRDVQVSFRKGRVTVAGEVTWRGFDVVLSVFGLPRVDREGKVTLHVDGIRVGAMPLPRVFVRDLLKSIQDRPIPASAGHWRVISVTVRDGTTTLLGEPGPHKD